jgi:NADH:ubiquinone oxidoreductase subunit E
MEKNCFRELDAYIDKLPSADGALIATLHRAQELYGCLSVETQKHIAEKLKIPAAKVYGVVTFYSYFTMRAKGKHPVSVCKGTACFVRGADAVSEEFEKKLGIGAGETSADGKWSLDCLRCVGACGLAPVVTVGEKVYGRVTAGEVDKIINEV